ncbi:MAG TPA: transposase family protein [Rhodothermales bacterium]|nr:transposase family protein [Rhodothermales bacterium]
MATRRELTRAIGDRYRNGSYSEKKVILTEFVAVTGYHRKHAIRVLLGAEKGIEPAGRARAIRRVYDEAVRQALVILWEASDRVCGKRLKSLLPILVEALERHGHLRLDSVVRAHVLKASAATIDRLLKPARSGVGRRVVHRPGTALVRRQVPVRTFADWDAPPPGYVEGDLVAHCGTRAAGSFVHTLTLTDIATGWTECVPLVVRQAGLVIEGLEQLRAMMPFPLLGFDVDNGSEFLNELMISYCEQQGIKFTVASVSKE